nr:immunoglobulin light chain junction region [Mus musculus]NSL98123.1 immunoglobulin light chain junction region [Mus musculus]NSL98140.1 immunoglobulin light chain junction region [Mus musculus]NSL99512.1 immunoglobulin light chain junction region [Mus musculus]NSL99788.1 immunoglobulin light chain junction region [Mus musculus]
CQQWSSNPLTF